MSEHTQLPWATEYRKRTDGSYGQDIYEIATSENVATAAWYPVPMSDTSTTTNREANAAFIVTACNSHDELVAALRGVLAVADRKTDEFDRARAALTRATT